MRDMNRCYPREDLGYTSWLEKVIYKKDVVYHYRVVGNRICLYGEGVCVVVPSNVFYTRFIAKEVENNVQGN